MARKGLLRQNNQAKTAEPKKRKGLLRQNSVSIPKKDEPPKEETHKRKGMIRQRLEEEKAVVAPLTLTERPPMVEPSPYYTGDNDIFRHINSETVIALKSDVSGCAQETTLTSGVGAIRDDIASAMWVVETSPNLAKQETLTSGVNAIRQDIASIDFDTSDLATSAQVNGVSADILSLSGDIAGVATNAQTAATYSQANNNLLTSPNGLASIHGTVKSKASQTSVDAIGTKVDSIKSTVEGITIPTDYAKEATLTAVGQTVDDTNTYTHNIYQYIDGVIYPLESDINYQVNGLRDGTHPINSVLGDIQSVGQDTNTTVNAINNVVANGTYGNQAIKTAIDNISFPSNYATSAQASTIDGRLTDANTGLSAIKNAIAGITIPTDYAKEATVVAASGTLVGKLDGTYGLQNIYNKANNAATYAYDVRTVTMNATYGNSAIKTKLDTTDTHATSGAQLAKSNNDLISTVSANIGTEYSQLGYNSLSDMCSTILNNEGIIIDSPYFGLSTINGNIMTASGDMVSGFNAVNGYLTNGTYGLNAIKTKLDSTYTQASNAATRSLNVYSIVNNGTYGNSAIKTKLDTTDTHATSAANQAALANTFAAANNVVLTNGTYGLPAIKNVADLTYTEAGNAYAAANTTYSYVSDNGYGLPAIKSAIDAISTPSDYAKQTTLISVSGDLRTDYLSVSGMLGDVAAALDIINGEVL